MTGMSDILVPQWMSQADQAKLNKYEFDFTDVRGQEFAKRALVVAAAGGHNLMMIGSPGTGKTMLAEAFAGILPPLTYDEMVEVTKIHSVAGVLDPSQSIVTERPFRSPHHTASHIAVVGGAGPGDRDRLRSSQ